MEEKKRAVAKKLITPNMQEWLPVSPKMPERPKETSEEAEEAAVYEEQPEDGEKFDYLVSFPGLVWV